MESDISLSTARELSSLVCMIYNHQTMVSDDDQLIWNISNSVADAIDCINTNKKFNALGLVELCRGSAKESQMDRMTYAVSALIIHLMSEREREGVSLAVNEPPSLHIPDLPPAPIVPVTVKEEEPEEQTTQNQTPAINGDRVVKDEPLDEDDMIGWAAIPRQDNSVESVDTGMPSRKRSADASEMEDKPEEKVKKEVEEIKTEDTAPLFDTFTPGGNNTPSTSFQQPAYRIHETSASNRPIVRIIKASEASTSQGSGARTIRIVRRGDPTTSTPKIPPQKTSTPMVPAKKTIDVPAVNCKAKDSSTLVQIGNIDHKQPNQMRLMCDLCDFYCMSKVVLTSHFRTNHPREFHRSSMPCGYCDFRTIDAPILEAHLNWWYCKACDVSVPLCQGKAHKGGERRSKLAQIKKGGLKRKDEKTNWCLLCHQSLPLPMTMKEHQDLDSNHEHACRKKCSVPVCDLATKNAGAMQTHERSHTKHRKIENFKIEDKCPYCDDYITDAKEYNEHVNVYHKELNSKPEPPSILVCTGKSAAKGTPCPFKCAKVHQMLAHWEKLDPPFHDEPAFKFNYDLARSILDEHGLE